MLLICYQWQVPQKAQTGSREPMLSSNSHSMLLVVLGVLLISFSIHWWISASIGVRRSSIGIGTGTPFFESRIHPDGKRISWFQGGLDFVSSAFCQLRYAIWHESIILARRLVSWFPSIKDFLIAVVGDTMLLG